jgi:hypothetical protein
MSDYVKSTNFAAKDALPSGNAAKIVKGTEIDAEFSAIETAIATKANSASPTFTGTVTLGTDLAITEGGTGASTAAGARTNLGFTAALVDRTYAEYTTNALLTATIPNDDTIPQSSEGSQIISVSFTPKSATSRVRVRFEGQAVASNTSPVVVAIFNGNASAIDARIFTPPGAAVAFPLVTEYEYVPGSTSAITFSVRVGPTAAANVYLNGGTGGRLLGGVSRATLVIEEYAV